MRQKTRSRLQSVKSLKNTHAFFGLSSLFNRALRAVRLELDDADDAIRAFFVALFDAQIFDYGQHVRPLLGRLCSAALRRGIESGIVRDLIKRRKLVPPADAPAEWPWPVKIESLSGFHVYLWDEPLIFDGKSQKKPMEMLMLLVALGDPLKPNKGARIDEIIDELGPAQRPRIRKARSTSMFTACANCYRWTKRL